MPAHPISMTDNRSTRFNLTDVLILTAITVVAAALRFCNITALGLTHFDEGGYALTALALADPSTLRGLDFAYMVTLAPPVFPTTVALLMKLTGSTADSTALATSAIFSTLTVPLIFILARAWIGRPAAIAAATLVALLDYHIISARIGLTDTMFAFWFLLALGLFTWAHRRQSWIGAILAGLVTGIAWNTKYHGPLVIVVAGLAILPQCFFIPRAQFIKAVARIAVAGCVAALCYLPWFLYVNALLPDGYAGLLELHTNHVDLAGAADHIKRHVLSQLYLDGYLSRLAPAIALSAAMCLSPRSKYLHWRSYLIWITALLAAGFAGSGAITIALLAAAAVIVCLSSRSYSLWILLAFLFLFTVMSPMYRPYSRLLMPWLYATALLAGAMMQIALDQGSEQRRRAFVPTLRLMTVFACVAVAALGIVRFGWRQPFQPFRLYEGFRPAVQHLAPQVQPNTRVVVLGEPAAVFYFRRAGLDARHVNNAAELDTQLNATDPIVLVLGQYARQSPFLADWVTAHQSSLSPIDHAPVNVSDVRLLDHHGPQGAAEFRNAPRPEHDLYLYHYLPQHAEKAD